MTVQSISAITLAVRDMARSVAFYEGGAGIPILYGGPDAAFTSLQVGDGYLNLILCPDAEVRWWDAASCMWTMWMRTISG